jgi:nucleoside-diphosphate-sugar epimerase
LPKTIFLAGAAGVIGRRLVPMLVGAGHRVIGTTRSPGRMAAIAAGGAHAVLVDVFDAEALATAVRAARPDVAVHQLTDLAAGLDQDPVAVRRANARLRREGTANLVWAALAAGTPRMVAQSIAWAYTPGMTPYSEDQPLDVDATGDRGMTIAQGIVPLERAVLDTPGITGLVLRHGQLYGPGTWAGSPDGTCPLHVDAAAYAAFLAVDRSAAGAYNIADAHSTVSSAKAMAEFGWTPDFRLEHLP